MNNKKYYFILGLFLLALISSAILVFVPLEKACGSTKTTCYAVQTSQYEKTFGINNSYMGLVSFTILSIITILHMRNPKRYKKNILFLGILAGSLFAIYFIYLQIFVIKMFCKYCLVADFGILLNLIIILTWKER